MFFTYMYNSIYRKELNKTDISRIGGLELG